MIKALFNSMPSIQKHSVLAIGNFDGLHLGHRKIINTMQQVKRTYANSKTSVLFFEPISKVFFNNTILPINTTEEKVYNLKNAGIEEILSMDFNAKTANMEKDEFIDEILLNRISPQAIVVGSDFRFGKKAEGSAQYLRQYLKNKINVEIVEVCSGRSKAFSSTNLRKILQHGNLNEFASHAACKYSIIGRLIFKDSKYLLNRNLLLNLPNMSFSGTISSFNTRDIKKVIVHVKDGHAWIKSPQHYKNNAEKVLITLDNAL